MEQAELFKIGQNRPCAAIPKGVIDGLLFLFGAVNHHPTKGHLLWPHDPFQLVFV